jgi:hypothetical protein
MRHFRAQDGTEHLYEGLEWQGMLGQLKNHRKPQTRRVYLEPNAPESANFKAEARRKLVYLACFDD